ncbi:hypothetical protein [Brunnivagina elsteri]|uniref:Uncharacterized protein n=1 Tax=Brunnivagina elsteri CCALA 953 TaxID=987040 RepID=A0A2A2TG57_9CYAN|nr:hypothetical protein [Calothrix elsteri]PAX52720.1 hypothetical protein CK510_17855 [Calothrix elsteri CCALA 953]
MELLYLDKDIYGLGIFPHQVISLQILIREIPIDLQFQYIFIKLDKSSKMTIKLRFPGLMSIK